MSENDAADWEQTEKQLFELLAEGARLAVDEGSLSEDVLNNLHISSEFKSPPTLIPFVMFIGRSCMYSPVKFLFDLVICRVIHT